MTDVIKPSDDPFSLIGHSWPRESESAYRTAEMIADEAATSAQAQSQSATDSARKTSEGMQGQTSDSVSGKYASIAAQLDSQGQHYRTISGWMLDASGEVSKAKNRIAALVRAGTSEIREALDSELSGTLVTPSSTELTDKYRADISSVSMKLATELDSIGHSLSGDSGASTTPSYVRTEPTSTAPTIREAAHQEASGQTLPVEPRQLPEMPRAVNSRSVESPSMQGSPVHTVSPRSVNPTLSNLVSGSGSSGTPSSPSTSTKSPSATPSGTSAGQGAQAHQPNEQRQNAKSAGLPHIPSIGLPEVTAAAADIATAVSSATASQLPTAASTTPAAQAPASTGITPGTSGTAPVPSAPPAGLSPIGGLTPPPVVQGSPASQGTPATPSSAAPAPSPQAPAPAPRGPVADLGWIQRNYGLAPSLDLPKPESSVFPALFIAELAESEAHLHRALASLRHQFEAAGWGQPLAVATIAKGLENRSVLVTADALSIWPMGISLPNGVVPLDTIDALPSSYRELAGCAMVREKLSALVPRGWDIECLLSTADQTADQFHELADAGELLPCTVSRGPDHANQKDALAAFALAVLGSPHRIVDAEAKLKSARWVGVQPSDYLDVLASYHLADAADSLSEGRWADAVYAGEKYVSLTQSKSQAA